MDADLARAVGDLCTTLFVEGCVLALLALTLARR